MEYAKVAQEEDVADQGTDSSPGNKNLKLWVIGSVLVLVFLSYNFLGGLAVYSYIFFSSNYENSNEGLAALRADVDTFVESRIKSIRGHIAPRKRMPLQAPSPTSAPTYSPSQTNYSFFPPHPIQNVDAEADDGDSLGISFPGIITTADHTLLVDEETGRYETVFILRNVLSINPLIRY
jgi:hypothetical protein